MYRGTIARTHFVRRHPAIFREVGRDFEVLIGDRAGRGNRIVLAHLHDGVRLADRPSLRVARRRRQIFRIAFGRAVRDPLQHRRLVLRIETAIVQEFARRRIRMPRRHRLGRHARGNRLRPRIDVGVREQGHRSELAGPMTAGAVLIKDRRDVFRVRRRALRDIVARGLRPEDGQRRGDAKDRQRGHDDNSA